MAERAGNPRSVRDIWDGQPGEAFRGLTGGFQPTQPLTCFSQGKEGCFVNLEQVTQAELFFFVELIQLYCALARSQNIPFILSSAEDDIFHGPRPCGISLWFYSQLRESITSGNPSAPGTARGLENTKGSCRSQKTLNWISLHLYPFSQ